MHLEQIIFLAVFTASISVAFLTGGADERIAAAAMVVAAALSPFVQGAHFERLDLGLFFIDFVLLIILVAIALRSNRYWPLFASGFMLTGTVVHVFPGLVYPVVPDAYADMASFWAYPVQLSLMVGTALERPERALRT